MLMLLMLLHFCNTVSPHTSKLIGAHPGLVNRKIWIYQKHEYHIIKKINGMFLKKSSLFIIYHCQL